MAKVLFNHKYSVMTGSKPQEYEAVSVPNKENGSIKVLPSAWLQAITPRLRYMMEDSMKDQLDGIEEIRLRIGRPVLIRSGIRELTVDSEKNVTERLQEGYLVSRQDIDRSLEILSQSSLYAWEDEFRNGYLTIPGGHRVGIVGRAVLDKGLIKTLKDISGLNYRIGREINGCADEIIPYIIREQQVLHTLIVSPPQCGKTTLLRDIIRQISDGVEKLGFVGVNVGLVDERSEIAGMFQGQSQFRIGLRTDILDACPKAQGMIMLIRSMSPAVIATDEIGRSEDVEALYQALQAGVTVITTVHGASLREIRERPVLRELVNNKFFERIIVLSRSKGVGTLEAIYDGRILERVR